MELETPQCKMKATDMQVKPKYIHLLVLPKRTLNILISTSLTEHISKILRLEDTPQKSVHL